MIPPRIRTLITPSPVSQPILLAQTPASVLEAAISAVPSSLTQSTLQRLTTLHPTLPYVAYLLDDSTLTQIVIQRIDTQQKVWTINLVDLATYLYGEQDAKKLPAATKALGSIQSLQFWDCNTLYWSGMMLPPAEDRKVQQALLVKTVNRILVLNFDAEKPIFPIKDKSQQIIRANLDEKTLTVAPSSNVLPISDRFVLVGCDDGSLKCYDVQQQQIVKSIKGLGKGDWILGLYAANDHSIHEKQDETIRRIITLTHKGVVYLIEVDVKTLEIKPPLARFSGGSANDVVAIDQPLLVYDAHRDWIIWWASKEKQMLVWNLNRLKSDLLQNIGAKNIFKPEPTLTVNFPSPETVIGAISILHPALSSDSLAIAVATQTDILIMGATSHPQNAVSIVEATPLVPVPVAQLLQRDAKLDRMPSIQVHGIRSRENFAEMALATNIGILFLEFTAMIGDLVAHFGAGFGGLGKAILYCQTSNITYGAMDVIKTNPHGLMPPKNPLVLYESPHPVNFPVELQTRPFRTAPHFITSPSGAYICLFWPWEFRYEILHTATLLQKVAQRSNATTGRNPLVTSGDGIVAFCWVADDDTFAILHDSAQVAENINIMNALTKQEVVTNQFTLQHVGVAGLNVASSGMKTGMKVASSASTAATSVATSAASGASKVVKLGSKGMKKTFGLFGKKKKGKESDVSEDLSESDMDSNTMASDLIPPAPIPGNSIRGADEQLKSKYVELKSLIAVDSSASELSGSLAAATCSPLGRIDMRGGNRNIPTVMFGGPVLCIGSKTGENPEGHAHFYARKKGEKDTRASAYTSTGPSLPYPDFVEWDDDGCLCAIGVSNRVSVYLLNSTEYVFLGSVHFSSSTNPDAKLVGAKFIHGVLYTTTWNAVYCTFLGNLETGICSLDTYRLASSTMPSIPSKLSESDDYDAFTPKVMPLPLIRPTVLGYQSGSLLVSTIRSTQAIRITHPLLRLGALLGSSQLDRAIKWLDAFRDTDHEQLAKFLERRGRIDFANELSGLSLETSLDLAMRTNDIARVVELVEIYGVKGLRCIDMSRGLTTSIIGPVETSTSVVVSIGTFLLAHGNVELTRRLASECLRLDDGKRDAFALALLLLPVDKDDATRLLQRAVEDCDEDWMIGQYAKATLNSAT